MSRVGGAPPFKNHFIGRALVDALTSVQLENGPPRSLSRSLLLCLKSRVSLKLGAAPEELAAFNIWPSLNIEPTSSQISEETLESLKLRNSRKNSRASNNTEQPNQQKGIPRVTSRDEDTRDSFKPPSSFQLKSKYQTKSLKWLNRVVFISKVKTLEFSSWWSTRVKSCGNSKTVLYF